MNNLTYMCCLTLAVVTSCYAATFGPRILKGTVTNGDIDEASGIVVSRTHHDVIYTHNDKGDSSRFFAIGVNGSNLATFTVRNAQNYDWEDLTYGPCADDCASGHCSVKVTPNRYCIYISDTGDHHGDGAKETIYMVREPSLIKSGDVDVVSTLRFSWPEENAETLMIDPTGQLYIVSKVKGGIAKMAKIPSSAWGGPRVSLDMAHSGTLKISTSHKDPQGGDISPNGREMLLVYEDDVYYYSVPDSDYIKAVNNQTPQKVQSYIRVKSTEAITWNQNGSGFYTLPEGDYQTIAFYPKIAGTVMG
ncbi:uncharacterized protein LOC101858796 [Aplysia californica]|uniref:Uncharacterized protein LOC101858796 n=1 Tax=Aplysia californica TaxID=6500 RepID=A0ABM0JX95_APLCA|nr:uncharacterized protein LOC101858796 [Aplysia californica]